MILAEATRYTGQTHPCYGVQPVGWRDETRFMPWCYDGRACRWGQACGTHSDALAIAQQMAGWINQEASEGTAPAPSPDTAAPVAR